MRILLAIVGLTLLATQETVGIFHPDTPEQRIVLDGPDAKIIIDANPENGTPGIHITSKRTNQVGSLHVVDGNVVFRIKDPQAPNSGAALFVKRGNGYLQLRENNGAHVLQPSELLGQ